MARMADKIVPPGGQGYQESVDEGGQECAGQVSVAEAHFLAKSSFSNAVVWAAGLVRIFASSCPSMKKRPSSVLPTTYLSRSNSLAIALPPGAVLMTRSYFLITPTRCMELWTIGVNAVVRSTEQVRLKYSVAAVSPPERMLRASEKLIFLMASIKIGLAWEDRKSTRLNSSHMSISYAVFCLKKK